MTNLQPFEELVEAAKAEIVERHPELSPDNRGIDPSIIINAQAKQLLKAQKNAEGHIANHRRDQVKITELQRQVAERDANIASMQQHILDTDKLVKEKNDQIAELKTLIFRATGFMESHIDMVERNDRVPATFEKLFLTKLQQALKGEVK